MNEHTRGAIAAWIAHSKDRVNRFGLADVDGEFLVDYTPEGHDVNKVDEREADSWVVAALDQLMTDLYKD